MSISSLRSLEYLEQLPGTDLKRLYQQPSTALAVFRRMLPHLAKTFVMSMLFLSEPFAVEALDSWVRADSKREQDSSIDILERLHILSTVISHGHTAYRITDPFRTSLRLALTGGGHHKSFGVPCEPRASAEAISIGFLDDYARRQWEAILYYIVGSVGAVGGAQAAISPGTKTLLVDGNLVEIKGRTPSITEAGFEFLLQQVNAQVWNLLIVYLETAAERHMANVDILAFIFTLGSLDVGQDYSTATLSPTQQQMLEDLSDVGIIYRDPADPSRFYPTRLATTLTSDSNPLANSDQLSTTASAVDASRTTTARGFIVIETNYRIYAYTSSPLQIAILNLFTKLSTRYPNMVSGRLTKESIQNAITRGITSQQIISYLTAHAHPVMADKSRTANMAALAAQGGGQAPILPPTVVDQIRLWQIEGDRMKSTTGFFFTAFANKTEYEECAAFAETVGVLVWKSEGRRSFFVTRHEQVAAFFKNRQKRMEASGPGAK